MSARHFVVLALLAGALTAHVSAQVTFERLLGAVKEPHNWLTYGGTYSSQRYTTLDQITPSNVAQLELKWVFQSRLLDPFETTPLVVDGILYTVQGNDVVALDAATGQRFWMYRHQPTPGAVSCCGLISRGVAILNETIFLGAGDARLVALDAKTGKPLWDVTLAKASAGYSIKHAPLVIKDKVIVGMHGGEYGIRGFIGAYEAATGKEVWRFNTVAGPGEPGGDTWGGDSWMRGGASVWVTGSYDPESNLTYWGIGNPGPDYNGDVRPGDNLYSCSVVALDADTGRLKWYYQFNPHNEFDWDAVQIPLLAEIPWQGKPRKVILTAQRNGFFYVLDRLTGEFLMGKPFVRQNWNAGFDGGRPVMTPNALSSTGGHAHLSRQPGRHELVQSVIQPAHGTLLRQRVGKHSDHLCEARRRVSGRPLLYGRSQPRASCRRALASGCQAGDNRSTTGWRRRCTPPCGRSIRERENGSGNSSSAMRPTAEFSRPRPTCSSRASAKGISWHWTRAPERCSGRFPLVATSSWVP